MADSLDFSRQVLDAEIRALTDVRDRLGPSMSRAVQAILDCAGRVIVVGVGKPWFVAQKVSATMASTGTPSFPLHPNEAVHGDIGRVTPGDVVVMLSNSGASDELVRILPLVKQFGATLIAVTGRPDSPLGEAADVCIDIGRIEEACPLGLAPSASSTALLAVGDALALAALDARDFTREDYARFHPAGALGRRLTKVARIMRPLDQTAVVRRGETVAQVLEAISAVRPRVGAAFVVDAAGTLVGVFTDGDLRRLLSQPAETADAPTPPTGTDTATGGPAGAAGATAAEGTSANAAAQGLQVPVAQCMTPGGVRVTPATLVGEALAALKSKRIDELAVVDEAGKLLGHLDVQDLLDIGLSLNGG